MIKKENIEFCKKMLIQLEKNKSLLLEKLRMARLDGDYKDNADQQMIEKSLIFCQEQIDYFEKKIVKLKQDNNSKKIVVYRLLNTRQKRIAELIDDWESDPSQNIISSYSPLGMVLSQKKIGEIGEVKTEQQKYQIKIIDIK